MPTAISAAGVAKANSLSEWEAITIHFDDGSTRVLSDVTATLRQVYQLSQRPADYKEILGVADGEEV